MPIRSCTYSKYERKDFFYKTQVWLEKLTYPMQRRGDGHQRELQSIWP